MILAGDIGGTKTNVALVETDGTQTIGAVVVQEKYTSAEYSSLEEILQKFLAAHGDRAHITHACFGIAGPVVEGVVSTPNLKWKVAAHNVAATVGLPRVGLINDLEATAFGIDELKPEQIYTLNPGDEVPGAHRALIAAGTGLGMAGLFWDGTRYRPIPSEGGHSDFAPNNEHEVELWRYLLKKFNGHVSWERALSGPGLFNVYSFLRDTRYAPEEVWLADQIAEMDASAAVSRAALEGRSELAIKALDMFTQIYGAMAGNLALTLVAQGGIFVGGGIAPKIIEKLKSGAFMHSFTTKGRMSGLAASMPVRVILDDKTALYGAARSALNS